MGPPWESELVCTSEQPHAAFPNSGQPLEGLVCPQALELGLLFLIKPRTPQETLSFLLSRGQKQRGRSSLGSLATCALFLGAPHVPPILRQGQLPILWHSVENENIGPLLKKQKKKKPLGFLP